MFKKIPLDGFITGLLVVILITNVALAAISFKSIKVTFDKIQIIFDGDEKIPTADSKPITYNRKIYVPLDFIAKSIGKNYYWDAKSKIAYIDSQISNDNVVRTSDGFAQLTFPMGWEDVGSSGIVTLDYSNGNEADVMVLRENKSVLTSDATIDDYCSLITNNMMSKLENPIATNPSKININNYSALQFEIRGITQKVKIQYLVTIVATKDSYYQLIGYTNQDIYDKNKTDFTKIFNTFKEIPK